MYVIDLLVCFPNVRRSNIQSKMLRFSGPSSGKREGRVPGWSLMISSYWNLCSSVLMPQFKMLVDKQLLSGESNQSVVKLGTMSFQKKKSQRNWELFSLGKKTKEAWRQCDLLFYALERMSWIEAFDLFCAIPRDWARIEWSKSQLHRLIMRKDLNWRCPKYYRGPRQQMITPSSELLTRDCLTTDTNERLPPECLNALPGFVSLTD